MSTSEDFFERLGISPAFTDKPDDSVVPAEQRIGRSVNFDAAESDLAEKERKGHLSVVEALGMDEDLFGIPSRYDY